MKKNIIPTVAIFLIALALLSNCQKKKDPTPTPTPTSTTTQPCFNVLYNGTYVGSGYFMSTVFTSGTLTVSKSSCQVVNLNLYTNAGGGTSSQASQLIINSANDYVGKQSNGNNITISPGGNNLIVNAVGSFTINGVKVN